MKEIAKPEKTKRFNNRKYRIFNLGEKDECIYYVVFFEDKLNYKWTSGLIEVPTELVEDPGTDHYKLVCEIAEERLIKQLYGGYNTN